MATPVPVLRLPKGPDPHGRGFDPQSARFVALCRTSIPSSSAVAWDSEQQEARSELRERFLRCLLSMANREVRLGLYGSVEVRATFGAADIDVLNFQVSDLHTPIGIQREALIRSQDVVSIAFDL